MVIKIMFLIFEIQIEIAASKQDEKTFIEHFGKLKSRWDELVICRPRSTNPKFLLKRAKEDKTFQLLASIKLEYENIKSNILMSLDLPSFTSVCTVINQEKNKLAGHEQ